MKIYNTPGNGTTEQT